MNRSLWERVDRRPGRPEGLGGLPRRPGDPEGCTGWLEASKIREDYECQVHGHLWFWKPIWRCMLVKLPLYLMLYWTCMAYLIVYPLITYSTIYEWSRDLALLCICVCVGSCDNSLGVSGDPHMRSWWLGLSSGSERVNLVIWSRAWSVCWARLASTCGEY